MCRASPVVAFRRRRRLPRRRPLLVPARRLPWTVSMLTPSPDGLERQPSAQPGQTSTRTGKHAIAGALPRCASCSKRPGSSTRPGGGWRCLMLVLACDHDHRARRASRPGGENSLPDGEVFRMPGGHYAPFLTVHRAGCRCRAFLPAPAPTRTCGASHRRRPTWSRGSRAIDRAVRRDDRTTRTPRRRPDDRAVARADDGRITVGRADRPAGKSITVVWPRPCRSARIVTLCLSRSVRPSISSAVCWIPRPTRICLRRPRLGNATGGGARAAGHGRRRAALRWIGSGSSPVDAFDNSRPGDRPQLVRTRRLRPGCSGCSVRCDFG